MSIRATILANLKLELEKIDGVAPFNYDVKTNGGVKEWEQEAVDFSTLPMLTFHWLEDSRLLDVTDSGGHFQRTLEVAVDGWLQTADIGTSSAVQLEELLADIERAGMRDPLRKGTGGVSIAIQTTIIATIPVPSVEGQPAIGGHVLFRIHYQHKEADPDS